jgi:hypothetical protein
MLHTLTTSMSLPLARDQVFAFFAEATNLQRITPPKLGFEIVTPGPIHLTEGTCIEYRLHLFGIPFSWQSEIQRWNPPEESVSTASYPGIFPCAHTFDRLPSRGAVAQCPVSPREAGLIGVGMACTAGRTLSAKRRRLFSALCRGIPP